MIAHRQQNPRARTNMSTDIFGAVSLAFAFAVTGGVIYFLWSIWRERDMERLKAFAESLPKDEQVVFWRLYQDRGAWNISRYPRALRKWKRKYRKAPASA
jgi:hypothetical protein